jgi:plastocyanin
VKMRAFILVALVALTGACGGGAEVEETPEEEAAEAFDPSDADTVAAYTLVDFEFQGPTNVKGPNVLFTAENKGTQDHELELLDEAGEAVGEVEAFSPGAEAEPLAAVLEPGTYTIQCILETEEGEVHKDLGMVATLMVE